MIRLLLADDYAIFRQGLTQRRLYSVSLLL
jgi:hypothetical protein